MASGWGLGEPAFSCSPVVGGSSVVTLGSILVEERRREGLKGGRAELNNQRSSDSHAT
jgi:hypothetical protein